MQIHVINVFLALGIGALAAFFYLVECRKNPPFLLTLVMFYSAFTKFVSVIFLEVNPIFLSETNVDSFYSGAAVRFLLANSVLFISTALGCRVYRLVRFGDKSFGSYSDFSNTAKLLVFILLVQLINFVFSAGLSGVNPVVSRWNYWESYAALKFLPSLFGKLMIFYPVLLGVMLAEVLKPKSLPTSARSLVFGIAVGYFVYLVVSGQRVNGIIAPMCLMAAAFLICNSNAIINFKPVAKFLVPVIGCIALVGFYEVQGRGISEIAGAGLGVFLYRIFVLTGATYWTVDNLVFNYGERGDLSELVNGMESLIYLVMPDKMASGYLDGDINLSGGLPVMAIYAAGLVGGIIVVVAYGLMFGLLSAFVYFLMRKARYISLFFASYLVLWASSVYTLASFENIYDFKFVMFLLVVLMLRVSRSHGRLVFRV